MKVFLKAYLLYEFKPNRVTTKLVLKHSIKRHLSSHFCTTTKNLNWKFLIAIMICFNEIIELVCANNSSNFL